MLALLLGAAWPFPAHAGGDARDASERVQLTALAGLQYGGKIDGDQGKVSLDSAPAYTFQAGVRVQEDGFVALSYTLQPTRATASFDDGRPNQRFDLDVGLIQFAGELEFAAPLPIIPFIGLSVGATHLTPHGSGGETQWFFSGTATAGAKWPITKHIGLRTHARFIGTLVSSDTSFVCVSNGGATCVISVSDTKGILQGDIVAGLYISF